MPSEAAERPEHARQGGVGRGMAAVLWADRALATVSRIAASAFIVVLMLLVAVAALGRYTGTIRVPGAVELSGYALVGLVYVGLATAMAEGRFIRVELVYSRLRPGVIRWLEVVNHVIALAVTLILAAFTWALVVEAYTRSIRTIGELRWPLFPIYSLMEIGLVLLALQLAARVVISVHDLKVGAVPAVVTEDEPAVVLGP